MNFNESEDALVYIMKYNIKNVIVNSNGNASSGKCDVANVVKEKVIES